MLFYPMPPVTESAGGLHDATLRTFLLLLSLPRRRVRFNKHAPPAFTGIKSLVSGAENLVASPVGSTIAWTFNERGVRNITCAEAPGFEPRRLTAYRDDDGQELTAVVVFGDGATIVTFAAAIHGSNRRLKRRPIRRKSDQPKVQMVGRLAGGAPILVGEGDEPVDAGGPRAQRPRKAASGLREKPPDLVRADRRLQTTRAGVLRAGHQPVAVWSLMGGRLRLSRPERSQLHRAVHGRTAGSVCRAVDSRDSLRRGRGRKKIAFLRQLVPAARPVRTSPARSRCRGRFLSSPMWRRGVVTVA